MKQEKTLQSVVKEYKRFFGEYQTDEELKYIKKEFQSKTKNQIIDELTSKLLTIKNNNIKMKIIKTVIETTSKPFALVIAKDESDAEIYAQENAYLIDEYFEGMETGSATEVDKSDFQTEIENTNSIRPWRINIFKVFHVPFN